MGPLTREPLTQAAAADEKRKRDEEEKIKQAAKLEEEGKKLDAELEKAKRAEALERFKARKARIGDDVIYINQEGVEQPAKVVHTNPNNPNICDLFVMTRKASCVCQKVERSLKTTGTPGCWQYRMEF